MTGVDLERCVNDIRSALAERASAIVLFESQARGDAFDDSDVDLAVLLAPGLIPNHSDYRALDDVREDPERLSIFLIRTTAERPTGFLLELARDHRVLWERTPGFVEQYLGTRTGRRSAPHSERRAVLGRDLAMHAQQLA